jgi:hypothetical protein
MPSPFPGMDPYLELAARWPGVHTRLIVALGDALLPLLPERYYPFIEERVYRAAPHELEDQGGLAIGDVVVAREREVSRGTNGHGGPEGRGATAAQGAGQVAVMTVELPYTIEVTERYLEVRDQATAEVVTVIEVLSPTNKRRGEGRRTYEEKRSAILSSRTNLVEIDLLRAGTPPEMRLRGRPVAEQTVGDYRVLVARSHQQPSADLYVLSLRQPLPVVPVPLRRGEPEPQLDLQAALNTVYDQGAFARLIDYRLEPDPPLSPENAAWADRLLRERGRR